MGCRHRFRADTHDPFECIDIVGISAACVALYLEPLLHTICERFGAVQGAISRFDLAQLSNIMKQYQYVD
jgi:hypothetical protein